MGLTAKRRTEDEAEMLARATALLKRDPFPSSEVKAAISIIGEVRAPTLPKPRETDERQIPIPLPDPAVTDPNAAVVKGCPLRLIGITRRGCVKRQQAGDSVSAEEEGISIELHRSRKKRGVDYSDRTCKTSWCAVGAKVRAALGDEGEPVERRHWKR